MRKFAPAVLLCAAVSEMGSDAAGSATALETIAEAKKERKAPVSQKAFVTALKAASARVNEDGTPNKPTAAELADELGMEKPSFDQRLNQLRVDWKDYGFVVAHKNGATPESLKMTQAEFDKVLARVKTGSGKNEDGPSVYDSIAKDDEKVTKPFPWTLADGRGAGGNSGAGVVSTRNAILAALMEV